MTSEDRQLAAKIAEQLRKHASKPVKRVILYGSRARGTAKPQSDFDFLVIEADPVSKREEMNRLRHALSDRSEMIDAWVMGEQEFEETKTVIGGLAYPAHKYGVVVYENP
jgi:uncharacterized protein